MITDKLAIFFDNVAAAASGTSQTVSVSPFAGRNDPVYVTLTVSGANAAAVSLALKIQESADGAANWTDVGTVNVSKPDAKPALSTFKLPTALKERFVRLTYTLTGTATGLKVFAGITRDDPALMTKGQYLGGRR